MLRLLSLPSRLANSNSAYDIVSYANNVKSTLKRTISCDSDDESTFASMNDSCQSRENIGLGKLQITINYNAYVNQLKATQGRSDEMFLYSLEEYLEISFIQARDLTLPTADQGNCRLFLLAWLDHEQKQVQQSQVSSHPRLILLIFQLAPANHPSEKSDGGVSRLHEMESEWWSVALYSPSHQSLCSRRESHGKPAGRVFLHHWRNLYLSAVNYLAEFILQRRSRRADDRSVLPFISHRS